MSQVQDSVVNVITGRKRPALTRPPVLSSASSPWRGVRLDQFGGGPVETKDEAPLSHTLVVQLERPTEFQWKRGAESGSCYLPAGSVSLFPAMTPVTVKNRDTAEFIRITFDPQFLLCAAHEVIQPERLELTPTHGVSDPDGFLHHGRPCAPTVKNRESLVNSYWMHCEARYPEPLALPKFAHWRELTAAIAGVANTPTPTRTAAPTTSAARTSLIRMVSPLCKSCRG